MTNNHSPAPWAFSQPAFNEFAIVDATGLLIMQITPNTAAQTFKADTNLIAAAPELLEAVDNLSKMINELLEYYGRSDRSDEAKSVRWGVYDAISKSAEAIKKAEGKK